MPATLRTSPTKCVHPLGFRYSASKVLDTRSKLRYREDLPRYDKHALSVSNVRWVQAIRKRPSDPLFRLERAAKLNSTAFVNALNSIKWQRVTAADFIRAIRMALSVGAHVAARRLAMEGADSYSDNTQLQKYARVLAPPKPLPKRERSDLQPRANIEWLKANRERYKGQWVAIKNGAFVSSAPTYKALVAELGHPRDRGILLTPIY